MTTSPHSAVAGLVVTAQIALGLLAASVLIGMILLFPLANDEAAYAPEFGYLELPFLLAGLAIGTCAEIAIVTTMTLARKARGDGIFHKTALRLVDVLVVAPAVATVITVAVMTAVPGPPLLGYALLVCVLSGIALVFVLLVLRALLRRAASMRTELDEVV